jgi:hypothetical protein
MNLNLNKAFAPVAAMASAAFFTVAAPKAEAATTLTLHGFETSSPTTSVSITLFIDPNTQHSSSGSTFVRYSNVNDDPFISTATIGTSVFTVGNNNVTVFNNSSFDGLTITLTGLNSLTLGNNGNVVGLTFMLYGDSSILNNNSLTDALDALSGNQFPYSEQTLILRTVPDEEDVIPSPFTVSSYSLQVPEPSSTLFVLAGLGAAASLRRRSVVPPINEPV